MTSATTTTAIPPAHRIRRLYLKGASVEVPHMASMPRTAVQPVIGIDVQTAANEGWPGTVECVLRMTLHARAGDTTAFVIEVTEAGVFELPGTLTPDDLTRFVRKTAPAILFPMARRDLAALAVAGGFQPVLLDHIDFDALITEIVKHKWATAIPTPVPLAGNMLEAAHAARLQVTDPATPAAILRVDAPPADPRVSVDAGLAADAQPRDPDTQPSWLETQPVRLDSPARNRSARGWMAAVLAGAIIGAVAWWSWPASERKGLMAKPQTVEPATHAATPANPATSRPAMYKPAEPTAAARRAIEESRERLAALPAGWRSIELGRMDADADLRELDALPLQAPVYLVRLPDGQLQVLYGAFPSEEAASAALEETRAWKAQGLRGEPRVVAPGRS